MYADLPLSLNIVEDPSFERGIGYWSTVHQWLPGTSELSWSNPTRNNAFIALDGRYVMQITNMSPAATDGAGGVWYDLGVLPAGIYTVRASAYTDTAYASSPVITLRAGRSNGVASPGIIGTLCTVPDWGKWSSVSGDFTSDGINPSMILITNETGTDFKAPMIDQVAVIAKESSFQLDTYAQMNPVADQDSANGLALKRFLRAGSLMFDRIESYVRDAPDGTLGWARICNPLNAPPEALDWLSQVSGTVIPGGTLTPEKRRLIDEAPGRSRGSRIAIVRATQNVLTGSKFVAVRERTTDDDHFGIAVLKSEAPASDWFTNIVTNPGLETNTTSWSTTGGLLTSGGVLSRQVGSGVEFGTAAGRLDATALGHGVRYSLGILPAGKYGFFFALKGVTGNERVYVQVGDTVLNAQVLANNWKTWNGVMTADGIQTQSVLFMTMTPTPATATFFFDAVMVGLSDTAPANYFDIPTTGANSLVFKAVEEARSVELRQDPPIYLDDDWSYAAVDSSYITWKDIAGNDVIAPIYKTYQDIKRHFSTYDDLKNNAPHSWENVIADLYDPMLEKTTAGWVTTGASGLLNSGATLSLQTTNFKRGVSGGRFVTSGASVNQGIAMDLTPWTNVRTGLYAATIFVKAVGANANIEVMGGPLNNLQYGLNPAFPLQDGVWTQINIEFTANSAQPNYIYLRNTVANVRTVDFDLVALTPADGTFQHPSTF